MDRDVVDLLQSDLSKKDPILAYLLERGHLTELTPEKELDHMEDFCKRLYTQFSRTKTHVIIPTYDCNLQCTYCWEKALYSKGKAWREKSFSLEKVDTLFEAIDSLDEGVLEKKPLVYFGGEPLLPKNKELIQYIMKKGTKRGYTHYFVTNGTAIQEYLPLLKKYAIHGVQVTLDGIQHIHDSRRKGPHNEGSFNNIVEGIELLRTHKITTNVRVNVDAANRDSLHALVSFLKEKGWHTDKRIVVYLAPVFSHHCGIYQSAHAQEAVSMLIALWSQQTLWEVFRRGVAGFHPLESALKGDNWSPQFYTCRAHVNQLMYDPHGSIYTCWEAVGKEEHCVGSFVPTLAFNRTYEKWMQRTVFTIKECRDCVYAFLCGGGCAYHAYTTKGTLFAPVCDYSQNMLKTYIPFYFRTLYKEGLISVGK